jgi:hypothetical protein
MQRSPFGEGVGKAGRGASMRSAAPSVAERLPSPWRLVAASARGPGFGPGAMSWFVASRRVDGRPQMIARPAVRGAAKAASGRIGRARVHACSGALSSPAGDDDGGRPASGCLRIGRFEWSSPCPRRRARRRSASLGPQPARISSPEPWPRLRPSTVAVLAFGCGRAHHRLSGTAIRSRWCHAARASPGRPVPVLHWPAAAAPSAAVHCPRARCAVRTRR